MVDEEFRAVVVHGLEKAGGSVRQIAQNDTHREVDFHLTGSSVNDAAIAPVSSLKNVIHLHLGKTGTTNAAQDVWFVGGTPEVVGTVWLGYDKPRSLGPSATGPSGGASAWAWPMPPSEAKSQTSAAALVVVTRSSKTPPGSSSFRVSLFVQPPRVRSLSSDERRRSLETLGGPAADAIGRPPSSHPEKPGGRRSGGCLAIGRN